MGLINKIRKDFTGIAVLFLTFFSVILISCPVKKAIQSYLNENSSHTVHKGIYLENSTRNLNTVKSCFMAESREVYTASNPDLKIYTLTGIVLLSFLAVLITANHTLFKLFSMPLFPGNNAVPIFIRNRVFLI